MINTVQLIMPKGLPLFVRADYTFDDGDVVFERFAIHPVMPDASVGERFPFSKDDELYYQMMIEIAEYLMESDE